MNGFHTEDRDEHAEAVTCQKTCCVLVISTYISLIWVTILIPFFFQADPPEVISTSSGASISPTILPALFANPAPRPSPQPLIHPALIANPIPFWTPPAASTSSSISSLLAAHLVPNVSQAQESNIPTVTHHSSRSVSTAVMPVVLHTVQIPVPNHTSILQWKEWLAEKIDDHVATLTSEAELILREKCVDSAGKMLWRRLRSTLGRGEPIDLSDLPGNHGEKKINEFPLCALFDDVNSCWSM